MRVEQLKILVEMHDPDAILLQEIKCQTDKFPLEHFDEKYQVFVHGQKAYNGIAVFVKKNHKAEFTVNSFDEEFNEESRYLEIKINDDTLLASVYVPNGQSILSEKFPFKLSFLKKLKEYLIRKVEEYKIIIAGDFNVALFDIDVRYPDAMWKSLGFNPAEQENIRSLLNNGFYDPFRLLTDEQCFSWWDYRSGKFQKDDGMRLDYFLISSILADKVKNILHCKDFRAMEKPSDHLPVVLTLAS